jgi:hypothetical protein
MDYFETVLSAKGCQQRKIMRHNIFSFCIPGKMIVVTTYSCVSGYFLRITEPTLTIGKSATFGMMVYLICVDRLAKIGHNALVIKKRRIFWISGIHHRINGINVLGIEVSPKEDMSMLKTFFDTRFPLQRVKLYPEFDASE